MTPEQASAAHWDVIVIGTGIGGGMAARRMAERGLKVLMLEQGPKGYRREETALVSEVFDPVARQLRGFWPSPITARVNGRDSTFFGPVGGGVGGSSVFYAATLERPEPHDLDHSPDRPHPTGGWPVSYSEMQPYFDQAEVAFHLQGEQDPLAQHPSLLQAPPELAAADQAMKARLKAKGLNPYHLHSAVKHLAGCKQCLGFKCPRSCKMDGRSAGVEPAMKAGAVLLDRCAVRRLVAEDGKVRVIEAERDGTPLRFTAEKVVLAAGAFGSPRLLLHSDDAAHPNGLANSNDQVGRFLMFHLNEMIAVWPGKHIAAKGISKALGFRDLYHREGERLGMVQAMGIEVGYGEILHYLRQLLARSRLRHVKPLKELARIPALIAARLFGKAQVYVGLMEDLPYAENRVLKGDDPDQISLTYDFSPELLSRRRTFRRLIRKAFKGNRRMFLGQGVELNYGHPCGTLRFGANPEASVLDLNCRAHEVENLYVADASVFPTSMGVNPSLTIAALALRVGDHIADQHERSRDGQK
ncbi:GMC oxidoreductase [Thalassobius sp. MITS945101]|uniref:GMC oxidoreductase n=1 Tax=Thalassobius sp. MITS945101 TaxID=3096994 RepID=UPI00399B1D5C